MRPLTEAGSVVRGPLRYRYEILYVAHTGFGNETLESTTRVPLAYPADHEHAEAMREDMEEIAAMIKAVPRTSLAADGKGKTASSTTLLDKSYVLKPTNVWRREVRAGILQAFVWAGALVPR